MNTWLALGFAVALTHGAQDVANDGIEVDWPTVEARLVGVDGSVEVGEPFEVELVCRHDGSFEVEHAEEVDALLALDERWVVFERRALPDVPVDRAPTRQGFEEGVLLESRIVYRIASLTQEPQSGESGIVWRPQRTLAGLGLALVHGDERRFVAADELVVEVASLLGPTDTSPRPLPEPLAPPSAHTDWYRRAAPFAAGAAVVFGLVAFGVVFRRKPTSVVSAPPPTRLERLAALRLSADAGERLRSVVVDAAALLRASCAARGATPLDHAASAALSDEEWRARLDVQAFQPVEIDRIERFLRQSQHVRFGAAVPTRWTVLDLLGEVEAIEEGTLARASANAANTAKNGRRA